MGSSSPARDLTEKNDQAWIEQKNGAVVRKLLGYRRFEGLAAARAITRLYGASRLFVNFFQPSFKLAAKQRDGAKVSKRYHPPLTPYERLLQSESISPVAKRTLREIAAELDPLKLLEEMRAVQAYLAALDNGVEATARYGGTSEDKLAGPGGSVAAGRSWDGGNGVVTLDYERDDSLYASDRAYTSSAPGPTSLLRAMEIYSGVASVRQELCAVKVRAHLAR